MKILLTGASGLLGSHILSQGIKKGYQFHTISRNVPKRSYLHEIINHQVIKNFEIDLAKDKLSSQLFQGVDVVIHAAGLASPKIEDKDLMTAINIDAGKLIYEKAIANNVGRWIQISSIATMSDGISHEIVDESNIGQFRQTWYARTKYEFDQWLDKKKEIPTTIIHPCYMLGPYDSRPSSGAILFALKLKRIKNLFNTTKNFVAASDVAKVIFQSLHEKATGHYVIGGENITIKNFIELCEKHLNQDLGFIEYYKAEDDLSHLTSEQIELMSEFSLSNPVSYTKASKDLNYRPDLTVDQVLEELIEYFVKAKLLRVRK